MHALTRHAKQSVRADRAASNLVIHGMRMFETAAWWVGDEAIWARGVQEDRVTGVSHGSDFWLGRDTAERP